MNDSGDDYFELSVSSSSLSKNDGFDENEEEDVNEGLDEITDAKYDDGGVDYSTLANGLDHGYYQMSQFRRSTGFEEDNLEVETNASICDEYEKRSNEQFFYQETRLNRVCRNPFSSFEEEEAGHDLPPRDNTSNDPFHFQSSADHSSSSTMSSLRTSETSAVTSQSRTNLRSPAPPLREMSQRDGGLVGLKNLGNTCYLNATLQCLLSAGELSWWLGEIYASGHFNPHQYWSSPARNNNFSSSLAALFYQMWLSKGTWSGSGRWAVDASRFKWELGRIDGRFTSFSQEDSQEALAIILDRLHEELKHSTEDYKAKSDDKWESYCARENSRVRELFHGQLRSCVRCLKCGFESKTYDPFCFLNLPIPTDVSTSSNSTPISRVSSSFKLLLFNETIYNADRAYLAVKQTFKDPKEFYREFPGFGVWTVELERRDGDVGGLNGGIRQIRGKLPSMEELQSPSRGEFIAYRADLLKRNFLVSFSIGNRGVFGIPILMRLPLDAEEGELTSRLFIEKFYLDVLVRIAHYRIPDLVSKLREKISLMLEGPEHFVKLDFPPDTEGSLRLLDLTQVIAHFNPTEEWNRSFFCYENDAEADDPEEFFEGLILDTTSQAENDSENTDYYSQGYLSNRCNIAPVPKPKARVSLQECFEAFLRPERLADQWRCEGRCGGKLVEAEKKLDLWRMPRILILHLKRFAFRSSSSSFYLGGGSGSKIVSEIDFTEELMISTSLANAEQAKYSLCAVTRHHGSTLDFGHYTAIVKHPFTQEWHIADDESIHSCGGSLQEVLKSAQSTAYVLFYRLAQ